MAATAQETVQRLASQALEVVKDTNLSIAQKRLRLDGEDGKGGIHADLKAAQTKAADEVYMDTQTKEFDALVGGPAGSAAQGKGSEVVEQRSLSLGDSLIASKGFQSLAGRKFAGDNWSTGDIDTKTYVGTGGQQIGVKTTFLEGTQAAPGSGFGPIATPTVLPGLVDIRQRPLTVMDLFQVIATDSPLVRYIVQSTATFNAAPTAEAAPYPEDALGLTFVDERLGKITTSLPLSDESLEDISFLRGFVDSQLTLDMRLAEEVMTLSGTGTAPQTTGLLNRTGLSPTFAKGGASLATPVGPSPSSDNNADAIYRMLTQIRRTAYIEPDTLVMNSLTWQSLRLVKDNQGQYLAGGPFGLTYGQQTMQPAGLLWGKPVVVSELIANGNVIAGCFAAGAAVLRKGGITLEATNSHSTDFLSGIQRVRASERLGLMVRRPQCFGVVTSVV